VTGYIEIKYAYGVVLNYYYKIEKTEIIHAHAPAILHSGREFPALMQQEAHWYPQLVWTGCEKRILL